MNVDAMIESIRNHREFGKVGMILTHTGIVRGFSRNGRRVSGVDITADAAALDHVVQKHRQMPGIIEIQVALTEKTSLLPGDWIMTVAVAGDVRENVLGAMASIIDAIKSEVTRKTEQYA